MADDTLQSNHEAGNAANPAEALTDAGAAFEAESGTLSDKTAKATATLSDGTGNLQQQAFDKARLMAEDGKAKAGGVLDHLAEMLTDAAGTVDEKLGEQFGQYARTAASTVSEFSEQVKAKDVDTLIDDAGGYVRQSPAVAIGVAAALGFVAVRLIQSSFDAQKA